MFLSCQPYIYRGKHSKYIGLYKGYEDFKEIQKYAEGHRHHRHRTE